MLKGLFSRISFLRRRARTLSHRNNRLKSDSDERRERWNQVIAEHQDPIASHKRTSTGTEAATSSPRE